MVNAVGNDLDFLNNVSKLFSNQYFRVKPDTYKGSELFAALKNILAIGMGIISIQSPGKNPQASLLTIGINDISNVYNILFPNETTKSILEFCGIGDIVLTCLSSESRNFAFGTQVAKLGINEALKRNEKTVEGYNNAKIFKDLCLSYKDIKAPFLFSIIDVLYNNKPVEELTDFIKLY
ncbi:UNVERIFIED_CONTAM: hypothetical protein O8I53_05980 [Campylobacter lari]